MSRGVPGRRPNVRWPIRRTVVCLGEERELKIEENTTVRCVRCGQSFLVNGDTAFVRLTVHGSWECVRCPHCGRIADAFYYLQEPKRPKIRVDSQQLIPWKLPEEAWF